MSIVGYLFVLAGLFFFYENELVVGAVVFFVGGFLAKKLYFSIRSAGVMLTVVPIVYGFHNEYSPGVIFLIFVGFVMANFNTRQSSERGEWGLDIDLSSFGSDSGSGSDGGGDGGGGE